jgi:tetratricopeptide (TPR) repeat protein
VEPVLTTEECENLITEAREVIAKGLKEEGAFQNDGHQPTNSQLGEARVSQMPRASQWLRDALHERFFPILESRFGIPANELTLNDALIIGYGYFGGASRSKPVHRDSDIVSLNVALSPQDAFDPDGGGTFFEGLPAQESIIKTDQGHVLCHSGGAQHAGRGIASGERWILVLFCVAESEPQLARRCHAKGLIAREQSNLDEAEATFRAGLTVAPRDHLLLSSLGGVIMAKGNDLCAQSYLSEAASSYEHCQKANLGLGRMMLSAGRPRAALRRFDAVLDYLNDCDLKQNTWMPLKAMGWDARVYGSHAAILCVQEAKKAGCDFDSSMYLQRAIERLNVALSAVPGDGRILSMLARAEELISEEDSEIDASSR